MTIEKKQDGNSLTVMLGGRLDTTTAPQLETEMSAVGSNITELVLDFKELEYISSAGLRVLLASQKRMAKQGEMKLINVCDDIREVFDITGFTDILTIE